MLFIFYNNLSLVYSLNKYDINIIYIFITFISSLLILIYLCKIDKNLRYNYPNLYKVLLLLALAIFFCSSLLLIMNLIKYIYKMYSNNWGQSSNGPNGSNGPNVPQGTNGSNGPRVYPSYNFTDPQWRSLADRLDNLREVKRAEIRASNATNMSVDLR